MGSFNSGRDSTLSASSLDELRSILGNMGLLGALSWLGGRGAASETQLFVGALRAMPLRQGQLVYNDMDRALGRAYLDPVPIALHGRDAILPVNTLSPDARAELFLLCRLGCSPPFLAELVGPMASDWGPRVHYLLSNADGLQTRLLGTLSNLEFISGADLGFDNLAPWLLPDSLTLGRAFLARRLAAVGVREALSVTHIRALALLLTGYSVVIGNAPTEGRDASALEWGLFDTRRELTPDGQPNMTLGATRLGAIISRAEDALRAVPPALLEATAWYLEPQLKDLARSLVRLGASGPTHDAGLWSRLTQLAGFIETTPTYLVDS